MGRLVDFDTTSLEEHRIRALPLVKRFFARLGLRCLLSEYVQGDPRAALAYADVLHSQRATLARAMLQRRHTAWRVGSTASSSSWSTTTSETGRRGAHSER